MELRSWEFRAKTAFTASPCRKELEEVLCSRARSSWVLSVAASLKDLGWGWELDLRTDVPITVIYGRVNSWSVQLQQTGTSVWKSEEHHRNCSSGVLLLFLFFVCLASFPVDFKLDKQDMVAGH